MKKKQLRQLADKLMDMSGADFILYKSTLQGLKEGDDFYKRLSWYIFSETYYKNTEFLTRGLYHITKNEARTVIARIVCVHYRLLTLRSLANHGRYAEDYVIIIKSNLKQLRQWKTYEKKCGLYARKEDTSAALN